jgi:hypothetical protein
VTGSVTCDDGSRTSGLVLRRSAIAQIEARFATPWCCRDHHMPGGGASVLATEMGTPRRLKRELRVARELQRGPTGRRAGLGRSQHNSPAPRGIMTNRILFSSLAAAALLTAAPTFAADDGPSNQPRSCCSNESMHGVGHHMRGAQHPMHGSDHCVREAQQKPAAQARATEENPDIRNQSFGG